MQPSAPQTVLVVDDDPSVLTLLCRALGRDYRVLPAASSADALELFEKHASEVDLAISDVVMPLLNGPDLVDRLRAFRPDLRVVFISGYASSAFVRERIVDRGMTLVTKPFSLPMLMEKVREELSKRCSATTE